jgi:cellulose synthase/poly-beta-1,6-N-acetylglucosamine synthase-like glycosyltransferase
MHVVETTFWFCLAAVAYNYAGYPILLFCLSTMIQAKADFLYLINRRSRRCLPRATYLPRVALIISAYNEAAVIRDKVDNSLQLEYPEGQLEIWFGLDAPSDATAEVLKQGSIGRIHVVEFANRRGKLAVLGDLAKRTTAEILIFTDANTMLDRSCVRNLVRHFVDSKVGAVSGEEIRTPVSTNDGSGESIYWRYESAIKILESRLNCSQGANGAALAIRRRLFNPKPGSIVEDFQIPLALRFQGYRVIYDPEAIATEELAPTLTAQFARRVRIGAGNYQTLFGNLGYLNPFNGFLTFAFISHRLLRWLAPFMLVTAFLCSIALTAQMRLTLLVALQFAFYLAGLLGYVLKKKSGRSLPLLSAPLHFCSMNLALFLGFCAYVSGRQGAIWASTPRGVSVEDDRLLQIEGTSEARQAA